MELQFSRNSDSDNVFKYEPPSSTFISSQPTQMDPYDRRYVYIANSTLGDHVGDGLFAKRNIKKGQMIVNYHGVIVNDDIDIYHDNMTIAERENIHKNLLYYTAGTSVDIPPKYDNIIYYRASLGHKVSF